MLSIHRCTPERELLLWACIASVLSAAIIAQGPRRSTYKCPGYDVMAPCSCVEKYKGLDVRCDRGKIDVINATMQRLKTVNQALYYLKLRNLNMPILPEYFFDGLELTHLILISSNVTTVSERAFAGLDRYLETLDLSLNGLQDIPNAALRNLKGLVNLNLNYNNITYVRAGALDGLENLVRVTLYGNGLTGLNEHAFSGSSHTLTRLNLGANALKEYPASALSKLSNLEGLEIHENRIGSISQDDFRGLGRLDSLNFAFNRLKELQPETFGPHMPLHLLDLDGNQIEIIDKDAFAGIEDTLEWLKLGENRLDAFPTHALKKLARLRQLDLHGNNLSNIPDDAFDEYGHKLKVIDLHNNSISQIPSTTFYNLHMLRWLYLNENKIKRISQDTFAPVLDSLQTLDINGNPLVCDCDLRWLREWYDKDGHKFLRMAERIQCNEPTAFRAKPFNTVSPDMMTCPLMEHVPSTSDGHVLISFLPISIHIILLFIYFFAI